MAHEFHESGPSAALSFSSPFFLGPFTSFLCLQKKLFVIWGAVVSHRLRLVEMARKGDRDARCGV